MMRFADFRKESIHHEHQDDLLRKVGSRKYVLRRTSVDNKDSNRYPPYDEVWVDIHVIAGNEHQEPWININLSRLHHGHIANPLSHLTGPEFGLLAAIRETIDLWISGKLEVLPNEMPWEKLLPKL